MSCSFSQLPHVVQVAILTGDKAALRRMGKKGAQTRAENRRRARERDATLKEIADERRAREYEHLRRQRNEHICPVN